MKAVMQPPARGGAGRTNAVGLLVEDIDRHDRTARAETGDQGRIVGKPKVIAKPDKRSRHVPTRSLGGDTFGGSRRMRRGGSGSGTDRRGGHFQRLEGRGGDDKA